MSDTFFDILNQTENNSINIDNIEQQEAFLRYVAHQAFSGGYNPFTFIKPQHFTDDMLSILYEKITEYTNAGKRLTLSSLEHIAGYYKDQKKALDYIQSLINHQPYNFKMVEMFAYDIDERYKLNQIKQQVTWFLSSLENYKGFDALTQDLSVLNNNLADLTYCASVTKNVFEHTEALDDFIKNFYDKSKVTISSGLKSLDRYIDGFGQGELIVVGGRPSMGKTALLIHFAATAAEAGKNVLNFALEMTNDQNMARFIARDAYKENPQSSLNYTDIPRKKLTDAIYQKAFKDAKKKIKPILHNYDQSLDVDGIIRFAEQHAHKLKRKDETLDLIVIDYLQIIRMKNKRDAHLEIGEVTGKLKALAKKLAVPIILLSQLNRDIEKSDTPITEKRPKLTHLRQSGKIEEDADKVLFPFRPVYYERDIASADREYRDDYMEIIIAKNRQGETGIASLRAFMGKNFFTDTDSLDDGLTAHGRMLRDNPLGDKKNSRKALKNNWGE